MLSVSVRQFRLVCAVALVALLLFALPALGAITFSKGVTTLRMYKFYEAIAPVWVLRIYFVIAAALAVVGLVGMFNFWRLSRWCLVAVVALGFAARPFFGLTVHAAYEDFWAGVFSSAVFWLLIVSYWTPIAERFARKASGHVP
jgi:hypothetical protein